MFNNIGDKLRSLAVAICWIGIGVFIILGAAAMYMGFKMHIAGLAAGGVLVFILGPILSWVSVLVLYAFGDLVSDVQEIKELLYQTDPETSDTETSPEATSTSEYEPETETEKTQEQKPEPETESKPEKLQEQEYSYTPDPEQEEKYIEKYFS